VIGVVPVVDTDELIMMTSRGKIQRIAAKDINVIGRNTQGVRIMNVDEGDALAAIVRVPADDIDEAVAKESLNAPPPVNPPALDPPEVENEESSDDL
jgi:DNA gyrase subunit A